jgi:hypothetical protein
MWGYVMVKVLGTKLDKASAWTGEPRSDRGQEEKQQEFKGRDRKGQDRG